RVLETGIVRRVGGAEDVPVRVRVVAATNRRLDDEVVAGRFREDLFHRLHVLSIALPPLRDHAGDIPALVAHFLRQFVPQGETVRFDDEAMKKLAAHFWPGNIRELRNVVQRAVLMRAGDSLTAKDVVFPPNTSKNRLETREAAKKTLADIERGAIVTELVRNSGKKGDAADALGISRSTIHRKIEEYKIDIDAELYAAKSK
ncbi:MAG: sigma-54-dependent Fis family transcriptional regulator, partial [Clostridia bacterium]|nr:sigma-54-dependent Fis family transcriptional regulator [Deltaproteobacteria bacterium]